LAGGALILEAALFAFFWMLVCTLTQLKTMEETASLNPLDAAFFVLGLTASQERALFVAE
jgi:hypothetical protein